MANGLPIALDAMGGDHGTSPNVDGALAAAREDGARVILVGDEVVLRRELDSRGASSLLDKTIFIRHAPEVVTMDEKPSAAVRRKKGSSMRVASDLVKNGEASAVISAGNSGAMMAVALFVFGRIGGVVRPAIGTAFPSHADAGFSMLIDAGANTDCSAEQLFQFGLMGDAFMRSTFRKAKPAIGVMSNGTEDSKGTDMTRGALELLRKTDLNVIGHIEGNQILSGEVDVVVTDGFTGNVMLKTSEAVAGFVGHEIKRAFENANVFVKMAGLIAKRTMKQVATKLDAREFGAAPLLGLSAPAFIAHGNSDAYAIRRAIALAEKHVSADMTGHIQELIERWMPLLEEEPPAAPSSKQA